MLIKCEECGGQVSSEAKFCPHCGYVLSKTKKEKRSNSNKILTNLLKFEWVNDVGDWLSDIPVIGGCLMVLFALLIFGVIVAAIVLALVGLGSLSPRLGIIVCAIGFAVMAYFATYKWHARRKWMFWVALPAAIAIIVIAFFI